MLCLQLFAVLMALTFSDGFVPAHPKCEYKAKPKFCTNVLAALHRNSETLSRMSAPGFDYAASRLRNANSGIYEALLRLSENKTDELLHPLGLALDSESSAVAGVLRECNNDVTQQPCAKIFHGLLVATDYLVQAIIEVGEGQQSKTIRELLIAFGREEKTAEKFPGFLTGVLNVLNPTKGRYLDQKQR